MSKLLDYLLEDQTAVVFDVDGVLAVYEFGDLSHTACPDEDWEAFVRTNDPYAHVPAVRQIQRFIECKGPGRVFACSVAQDFEASGKLAFVTANYAIPAANVRLVAQKADKVAFLREVAESLGLPERRVALVEDTVKTLDLVANTTGFTTVHVSSFFSFGE